MKAKIALLATGGTIAGLKNTNQKGYTAGVLKAKTLAQNLPKFAFTLQIKQITNIDSCNMNDKIWLKLAKEIHKLFEKGVKGIVITHGTDTLEETAYFLNLVLKSPKAVVLTGAMRPFDSLSADGPRNLYNALILANDKNAQNKGVMIAMNDKILSARSAFKTHTLNIDAFSSLHFANLGFILDEKCVFLNQIPKLHTQKTPFFVDKLKALPRVDILYTYANDTSGVAAKAFFQNGTKGLVVAGSGAGNIHENHKKVLKELLKKGLKIVVSSRVPFGEVVLSKEDEKLGFISARDLNPQKARVLLSLALTKTKNTQKIRAYFKSF